MQVNATAQFFPVWQNGYTPEPVSQGSSLKSAVFAPVTQVAAATAGTVGVPGDTPGSKNRDGKSAKAGTGSGAPNDAVNAVNDAGSNPAGKKVNSKSQDQGQGQGEGKDQSKQKAAPGQPTAPDGKPLTQAQQSEVRKLQSRNRDVVAHEEAHKSVGGSLAGAISYTYERGPNGKRYAVGGDVPIQISQDPNNPQNTIARMRQVIAAALAPVDPSAQDRAVAARATQIMVSAQRSLLVQSKSANSGDSGAAASGTGSKKVGSGSTSHSQSSSAASPAKLYSDVAQYGGTPELNDGFSGLKATA